MAHLMLEPEYFDFVASNGFEIVKMYQKTMKCGKILLVHLFVDVELESTNNDCALEHIKSWLQSNNSQESTQQHTKESIKINTFYK